MSAPADSPLVSVVIPTHDRADWLPVAIASALAQTHAPLEVLVVDDGGRPATAAAVAKFDDPRLAFHRNPAGGIERNHRESMRLASGEFIVFLSDDDALDPEFVARRVARMREAPGCDVVFSGYTVADEALAPRERFDPDLPADRPLDAGELVDAAVAKAWSINGSMYRVSALRRAWPPPDTVGNAFDMALHLRLAVLCDSRGLYGRWCDVRYRIHDAQGSRGEALLRHFAEGQRMYEHVLGLAMPARIRRRIRGDLAHWQLLWARVLASDGDLPAARRHIHAAVRAAPWLRAVWTQALVAAIWPARLAGSVAQAGER